MTGCTLKILDPTLKFFLGKGTFDSYEEFRETLLNKVDDKLIPIGKEIKKIDLTVSPPGYSVLVGNNVIVFETLETLVNQMLAGLLETNDPNSQFSSFIQTADIYNAKYNSPEFITKQVKEKDLDFLESTLDFYVSYPVDQEFKNSDLYQEFLERTAVVREVISNLRKIKVEPELITDESTFQEDVTREPWVYVKSNDNNAEGNIELTTNVNEAIVLDKNDSKNLTFTLPDFNNQSYFVRDNPVNEAIVQEIIRVRALAKDTPSAFYEINQIDSQLPVSPKLYKQKRLITLREFLDNNKATRLEIASETDRVLYAGNLFVRFANEQKAALNRTTLSDSWKQRVIALVNHDYTEGGLENTKNSLNALLEYKGGDISFGKKGTRITVWRKSKKVMIDGKPKIVRLEHAEEIQLSELEELLDYAKINVDKGFLQGVNVDFPIIKNGKLDYTNENFVEFYKDHHKTIARQVLVNGQYHFTPIKSLQFNIQSPEAKKLEELEVKLENPKIGDLEIVPDTEISLMDVVNNLTSIANETTDSTRDVLILLNALLDNDEVKNKLSEGTVRFTTIKGKDFKGLVTNGKDVEINHALLSNMNLLGDVLAHEIIHVLTQRWLIANPESKIKKDLDALLLLVPDSVPNYNKKDIFELLGSISNNDIAAQLKTVTIEDKNLLEKLIDLFKELIGKIFGIESLEPNLYNEIVNKLVAISTSPTKTPEQPATKNKFGLKKRGDSTLPLGYSEEDLQQFYDNNNVSKSFLNLLVKSIDGDLAQHVHNKGKFQEFLAGKLDFITTFREIFDSYVDAADAKETYTKEEETFFAALADGDFIEEYWIANTNFAKVRKPKKGEQDKTAKEPVLEIDTNDNEEVNEALPQEDEKPIGEDKETINQMVQDGGNEDKMGVERGTDKSSLELADPMTRAFIKMLPKVERDNGQTKVYTKEQYEQSNDKDKFVLVTQDKYIKFSYNELGRVELCDYTPTWNLIALNLKNLLSIEEMMDHIESDPKLIDVIPEIYIFKERLDQPINNEFRAFKKAGVSIFAIIHDTETGNFLVKDESADFTMTAKQKINTQFINNVQTPELSKYYNSVNSTFNTKDFFKDRELINQAGEKNIANIDKNDKFLKELGFVLNVKTVYENGDENGFRRFEIQNFKQELVKFLIQFEEIEVRIADFITKDHGKIKGLNNWFKNVYEIENKNNPLVTTTMVKNAEGENQSVLSLYNGILQDRESYNKSKTEEELVEKIDRTRNDVFQYSITKKQLFRNNQRTDVKVLVDILSGLKVTEEGSATKGNLTIDLEDGEWLKLNFVGMLKNGIIENTRAETASTSYTFRLSDWSNKGKVQNTPFTIMDINEVWDVKEKKFNFGGQTSSEIYKAWSDYLKGELSRISKVGIRLNKDGSQAEQFGIYADILNKQDKEVLLGLLANSVSIDTIVANNSVLITNALDKFFTTQFEEYSDLFENVMGGYASILGNLMDKSVNEDDKVGDVGIYNNVFNETNSGDYREAYKAFFVVNALTLHTEESILFQGDLTESPKYFKRAKGVQSTGTPLSISQDLQAWVNGFLQQYSFASIIGGISTVGKTFDSATIEDDVRKSHYHTTGQLQKGYADSKKLYNEQIGKSQSSKEIEEEAEKLLADYAKNNIGDGDGKVTPDFYFALLALVGNITEEQILGFKALQLDARKNASKYNLGQDQQLTKEEELLMNEGLRLIGEGKVVFPKLKVTYRGNALTNDPVSKEIMDKFALFPLFPQFTYDKPAAHHLLKTMLKEGKAYTKFESGTKIQNLGKTKFLSEVEKGNFEVTLEDSQHTLLTEKLREQIKTPHKTKEKNTFGSQFRKLVISGLTALGKSFKLSTETIAGETVRQWEKLNQELSELTKEDVLKEFGISKVGDEWNYSQMNFPKVADLLLRESERKDLPDNIKVYFDKYKKGKLNQSDVDNYYKLFETSFGSQQIQSLIASIIKNISVQKLRGTQLVQVSQSIYDRQIKAEGKTRDLGFYHFKDGKVQAAECKVSLIGDFKNLLNLQEVKDKLKGIENPNILEQTRALNELLQSDDFVEKYKDQLTIIGYRIPTQGFNSMEVMVIREFLPTFHGPTIVCPPEITTQSGTDYDYDKLSVIFPSISKDGRMSFKGSDYVQNGMIKVSAQILLDPINYHRLVTPNTNAIIFDFLKGTKDVVGLLERLGISTKEYKNTEVLTMLVNLTKFKAVKGKGLLGIAAVWNTFTSLIQRHNWILNNSYTKSIGFGENKRDVDVNINPVLLKNKPEQINSSKPDTENGQSKQEIVSQLINVTVDMPSDDTFGKSIFNKSDFGALTYGISMLGYDFETSMLFFHQPVVYQYKMLVQKKIQEGLKARVAKFEAASELLGIDIPLDKKTGTPLWVEFEDRLFHQTSVMESKLDINDLNKDIKSLKEIPDVKIDNQQKAVLSHYLKLLDQASQIRTVQSAINFDTAPENSMYKVEERIKNRDEARAVNIINDSYLQEIERDSVVSGLNITSILSNVAKQLFPVLFNAETSNMFSNEAREYVGKEELAYRKVTNDFLLSILQNYGKYNGRNVFDVASSYIRGQNFLDFYKKGNEVKQILNKEGFNPRLLNILLLNSSKKKKNLNNPQLLLGFENTPEDKNKITEEWRTMLNSPNKEVKEFAETLAIIGIVQSGWAKSPIYFSDLIPEEFITPIISKAFDQYTQLDNRQQKEFRKKFIALFKVAEGKSLGRKGRDYQIDSYRLIDYTIALEQPTTQSNRQTEFEEDFSDEFEVDFGVTEKEGLLYELNDTQQLHPKDRFKHDGNLQTTLSKLLNIKERNSNNDYYLQTINSLINITNRLIQIESEPAQPQSDIFLDYVETLGKPIETTTTTDMSQLVNQPKTDKELINDYVTKVLTSQITPDWRKLGTPINTDRLRTNDSIPELVGLLKNKIKELETKLDEYEQDSEKFKDAIINVNSQIQGYGSLVFELENLKKQIPPLGYDEQSLNNYKGIDFVFEQNPILNDIGSKSQYAEYLNTIFPDSKVKDIVYRGSEKTDDKLFQYFTKNLAESYVYSKAHVTKGGSIIERNPISVIKDNIAKKYNLSKDILIAITDTQLGIDGLEFEGFITKEQSNEARKLLSTNNDIKNLVKLINLHPLIKMESEEELMKQFDSEGFYDTKKEYDKVRKELEPFFNIEQVGKLTSSVLNIVNPYIDEIVQEDLINSRDAYKNGHDGAFLADGDHFLVKKPEQIHILGSTQDISMFKKFVSNTQSSQETKRCTNI